MVTAVGSEQSTIWLHTPEGERQISSEAFAYQPSFSPDGTTLYYLVRNPSGKFSGQLTSVDLASDRKEELVPRIPISRYAVSPDSRTVVFTRADDTISTIWIAQIGKRASLRRLVSSQADMPMFSRAGEIFFVGYEGPAGHIFRIRQDGGGMRKLTDDEIDALVSISPDGRWIVAASTANRVKRQDVIAYSLRGADRRVLYRKSGIGNLDFLAPPFISWSADQKAIYFAQPTDQTKTVVVPVRPAEPFPHLSANELADEQILSKIPGARLLDSTAVFPGPNADTYAILRRSTQRNLYRIGLPSQ